MALKLMYITNRQDVAKIAEAVGVDRIFVDMEYINKDLRQGGMDTVQSHHTLLDVKNIKQVLTKSELLVRCNPIHDATEDYTSSKEEIDGIVKNGADVIMLPYFKTVDEVRKFVALVNGRARTMLLVETPEAVAIMDEILNLSGIDEVFIGLNDLSLGYGKKFMFELLADGTVEELCNKFKQKGLPFGFGGIAALGKGTLPSENIIKEHYRLGSTCVILSRTFCDVSESCDIDAVKETFFTNVKKIRDFEAECAKLEPEFFKKNEEKVVNIVHHVVEESI